MSEFSCPVVRLSGIEKHPNADTLSIVTVEGCPVVIRTADYKEGDLAIYVPIDAIVPESVPGTEFLGTHRRIRAARLRKVFSMGLLLPLSTLGPFAHEDHKYGGTDVAAQLGITKYDPGEPSIAGSKSPSKKSGLFGPKKAPEPKIGGVYDLESYRKYGKIVFKENDPVVVTEKIHGTNFRFGHQTVDRGIVAFFRKLFKKPPKTRFCVGSHRTWRNKEDDSVYWKIAKAFDLENKTREYPDTCFYGEIYGNGVQDLVYGCKDGELKLAIFDIFDSKTRTYESFDIYTTICRKLGFPMVPVLYRGPFKAEVIEPMRNGKSTLADQIREGVVIRQETPGVKHMYRGVLKLVGDDYLLRKGGTEFH